MVVSSADASMAIWSGREVFDSAAALEPTVPARLRLGAIVQGNWSDNYLVVVGKRKGEAAESEHFEGDDQLRNQPA